MKINQTQLDQVNVQIQRLLRSDNFYGSRLKQAGITGVNSAEAF
jgi:phenylacetate-CoA ligase